MSLTQAQATARFSTTLSELRIMAGRKRSRGRVTIDSRRAARSIGSLPYIDEYVGTLGFQPIGRQWKQLNRNDAVALMKLALRKEMAGKTTAMGALAANRLVRRFNSLFDPRSVQFYTNVEYHTGSVHVWQPLTRSAFDMAVIAFDKSLIGLLLVEDSR